MIYRITVSMFVCVLITLFSAAAQDRIQLRQAINKLELWVEEPATKFERFLSRKGTLIIKDAYEIGSLKVGAESVSIQATRLSEASSPVRAFGITVTYMQMKNVTGNRDIKLLKAFVDYDELMPLQDALDRMIKAASDPLLYPYNEQVFSTRGGVTVGFSQGFYPKEVKQTGFVRFHSRSSESFDAIAHADFASAKDFLGEIRNYIALSSEKLVALGAK